MFLQLAPEPRDVAQRVLALGHVREECAKTLRLDRLRQVVVCPFLHGRDRRVHAALSRDEHEGQIRQLILEAAQQIEPVHPRHDHVGKDHGRPVGGDLLEPFLAVGRVIGFVSPGTDQFGQTAPGCGVVFNDEHSHFYSEYNGMDGQWGS